MMEYTESEYLGFDPFEGDRDCDVRCSSAKMVKVRKEQECMLAEESCKIKPGEMARFEKAIFDGAWCSWYCCIPCMDKWFAEIGIYPNVERQESEG